jgi:antitoxin component of RelBE/YafQ-DinJ toxin-antitoxin module
MGLTLCDAFRLLVKRIAAERALPFEPLCRMKRQSPPQNPDMASSAG